MDGSSGSPAPPSILVPVTTSVFAAGASTALGAGNAVGKPEPTPTIFKAESYQSAKTATSTSTSASRSNRSARLSNWDRDIISREARSGNLAHVSTRDIVEADQKASRKRMRREDAKHTSTSKASSAAASHSTSGKDKDRDRRKLSNTSSTVISKHGGISSSSSSSSSRSGRAVSAASKAASAAASGGSSSSSSSKSSSSSSKRAAPVVSILSATNTWKRDVRPDKKNNQYHSLYSGDVTRYRRGTNSCIGLENTWVKWNDGRNARTQRQFEPPPKKKRYYNVKAKSADKIVKIVAHRSDDSKSDPFNRQQNKTSRWDAALPRPAIPKPPSFISLYGAAAKGGGSSSSGGAGGAGAVVGDVEEREESKEEWILRRTAAFNKGLRETPRDVELWRSFIAFQDEAFDQVMLRSAAAAILLDKKLALFEKALVHNPTDDTLIAEHLYLCRSKMDLAEVEARWKKTMYTHAGSTKLWREYLVFYTSEISRFKFSNTLSEFHTAIEKMTVLRNGGLVAHKLDPVKAEAMLLDLVTLSCTFQRHGGFYEKGVSCFRAAVEFAVYSPTTRFAASSTSALMISFESFWDSECARFGEVGAPGFASWLETRKLGGSFPRYTEANAAPDPVDDLTTFGARERWVQLETWRDAAHWKPWQPQHHLDETDEDCDDLDRLVVTDDVVGHLVPIASPHLQLEMVKRFLEYLGVSLRKRTSSSDSYVTDMMVAREEAGELFTSLFGAMRGLHATMHPEETAARNGSGSGGGGGGGGSGTAASAASEQPLPEGYPFGVAAGYDARVWGFNLTPDDQKQKEQQQQQQHGSRGGGRDRGWLHLPTVSDASKRAFIKTTFDQAINRFPNDNDLRLNYVDFLTEDDNGSKKFKAAKKLCKGMLKEPRNRNNLVLLDRYAQLERAAGKAADAVKVYNTALSMARALPLEDQKPSAALCRHLVELYLDQDNDAEALRVLLLFTLGDAALEDASDAASGGGAASTGGGGGGGGGGIGGGSVDAMSPTLIAKARNAFHKLISAATSAAAAAAAVDGSVHSSQQHLVVLDTSAVNLLACQAWLDYIVTGGQLDAVCTLYDALLDTHFASSQKAATSAVSLQHETIFTDYIQFIRQHSRRETTRPGILRNVVARALEFYPANPEFLTAFVVGEAKCRVAGRVRKHFDAALNGNGNGNGNGSGNNGVATRSASPVVYMFAVYAELLQMHGCSMHRVRSLLDKASKDVQGRRCILLWRMFLEFERVRPVPAAEADARVKVVFYRAIQNCPGAKALYLDGASRAPSLLNEVLEIMEEKELHLRTPLEELELEIEEEQAAANEAKAAAEVAAERENERMEALVAQEELERQQRIQRYLAEQGGGSGSGGGFGSSNP